MFKGKAIYNPSGKAGEYSYWAANFYNGCTGRCTYCYNTKGPGAKILGAPKPTLKASLGNNPKEIFNKELFLNISELKKHGLFIPFVSDPCLVETWDLTSYAIEMCFLNFIPIKILTKQVWWVDKFIDNSYTFGSNKKQIAIGFTLTGHDEQEPGCAPNYERIEAMQQLHKAGFRTWASIEPVIDIADSIDMIFSSMYCCDHYKIGLLSGKKFNSIDVMWMIDHVTTTVHCNNPSATIYWKDELLYQARTTREGFPANCVGRDYNMFTTKQNPCPTNQNS